MPNYILFNKIIKVYIYNVNYNINNRFKIQVSLLNFYEQQIKAYY